MKIAIVGSGISGLGAAWCLDRRYEVTLYESGVSLGGHANTLDVQLPCGMVPVDTGFIVYNEHNYPNLTRLFAALGVATVPSDMSFGVSIGPGRFEYSGSAAGLVAQPFNLAKPGFWRFLGELLRFYRTAPELVSRPDLDEITLGEVLKQGGYSEDFARRHLLPMVAAIWSSTLDGVLDFPARTFVQFFGNHGLFSLGERPQWRSVLGGSREYVRVMAESLDDRVRLSTPVVGIRRTPSGVLLRNAGGSEQRFDQVVLATHADQALEILGDGASPQERRVLGAFRYQENTAVLHRDATLMPRRRRAWASWNYLAEGGMRDTERVAVSYWMNRLQRLNTKTDIFVTLNPIHAPAPEATMAVFTYDHPQFDHAALAAQERLPSIQGMNRVWFCGSYCGYGFHEDGLQAGIGVAAALGAAAPWAAEVEPMSPAGRAVTPAVPLVAAE